MEKGTGLSKSGGLHLRTFALPRSVSCSRSAPPPIRKLRAASQTDVLSAGDSGCWDSECMRPRFGSRPPVSVRSVVKVGDQVLQPVPLGQVDWLGGPQHDHTMVGFRIAPLVLMHTRKYAPPARGRTRIRLKDWQRMAPALQKELSEGAEAVELGRFQAGVVRERGRVLDGVRWRK